MAERGICDVKRLLLQCAILVIVGGAFFVAVFALAILGGGSGQ